MQHDLMSQLVIHIMSLADSQSRFAMYVRYYFYYVRWGSKVITFATSAIFEIIALKAAGK